MKTFDKESTVPNTNMYNNAIQIFICCKLLYLYINLVHSFNFPSYYLLFFTKLFFSCFFLFLFKHIFLAGTILISFGTFIIDLASCYCKKEDVSVFMDRLKSAAFRRLRKFHIFFQRHQTTKFLKNCFNCIFSLPFCKNRYTAIVHLIYKFYLLSKLYIFLYLTTSILIILYTYSSSSTVNAIHIDSA